MKLIKVRDSRWQTEDKKYSVTLTHNHSVKGLHPKYLVSRGIKHTYVSTLKEARVIIDKWENE